HPSRFGRRCPHVVPSWCYSTRQEAPTRSGTGTNPHRCLTHESARPLREQWRAWRSPRTEATAMHNDTSAPLHICPDCVNRVNGDPAPAPDGWEYDWSIARYGKITTTGARYVES